MAGLYSESSDFHPAHTEIVRVIEATPVVNEVSLQAAAEFAINRYYENSTVSDGVALRAEYIATALINAAKAQHKLLHTDLDNEAYTPDVSKTFPRITLLKSDPKDIETDVAIQEVLESIPEVSRYEGKDGVLTYLFRVATREPSIELITEFNRSTGPIQDVLSSRRGLEAIWYDLSFAGFEHPVGNRWQTLAELVKLKLRVPFGRKSG